jgi:hypothetical protein
MYDFKEFYALGKIEAQVGEQDFLLEIINRDRNPKLTKDDVYIRSCLLATTDVTSHFGYFGEDELYQIKDLLKGRAVIRGHDYRSLPLAHIFHTELKEIDSKMWVQAYFYWMKNTSYSEDLARNIDGGVYREVSFSFNAENAICSVCEKDIRQCQHRAGEIRDGKPVTFRWKNILNVIEMSIVPAGATPNTKIFNPEYLAESDEENNENQNDFKHRSSFIIKGDYSLDNDSPFKLLNDEDNDVVILLTKNYSGDYKPLAFPIELFDTNMIVDDENNHTELTNIQYTNAPTHLYNFVDDILANHCSSKLYKHICLMVAENEKLKANNIIINNIEGGCRNRALNLIEILELTGKYNSVKGEIYRNKIKRSNLSELVFILQELSEEFNQVFPNQPQAEIMETPSEPFIMGNFENILDIDPTNFKAGKA